MIKDFYDFNHNQNMLDLTEELNVKVKILNPNINIQLLDNDSSLIEGDSRLDGCSPQTEFHACIGLSITYTPKNKYILEEMERKIPTTWEKHPVNVGLAFWDNDKHQYISHEWKDDKCFHINSSIKTPDTNTIKGRLNPTKKYEMTLEIVLDSTASTKFGLKLALQKEILNKIGEMNKLDKKLKERKTIKERLIEATNLFNKRGIK